MEVDLDKIERVAKAAENESWDFGLGKAEVCGEERSALWWNADANVGLVVHHVATANPIVVLELVRRLREAAARIGELEAERAEREKQEPAAWLDASTYDRPGCMVWLQDDLKGMDTTNLAPL